MQPPLALLQPADAGPAAELVLQWPRTASSGRRLTRKTTGALSLSFFCGSEFCVSLFDISCLVPTFNSVGAAARTPTGFATSRRLKDGEECGHRGRWKYLFKAGRRRLKPFGGLLELFVVCAAGAARAIAVFRHAETEGIGAQMSNLAEKFDG